MTAVPRDVPAFCVSAVRLGKQMRTVVPVPPVPVARGGLALAGYACSGAWREPW